MQDKTPIACDRRFAVRVPVRNVVSRGDLLASS